MRITRIYQPRKLEIGQTFALSSDAANRLTKVLRLSEGAEFVAFNGEGGEYTAQIQTIKKNEVLVQVTAYQDRDSESPLNIHLGQAISRGEKMDYTIQKAVELGVMEITPLLTERCGVKLSDERWEKRLEHWRGVIISACEQCGRNKIPVIHQPIKLLDWLPQVHEAVKLVLFPKTQASLKTLNSAAKNIALLIGPEGGLAEHEIAVAIERQFIPIQIGPRILRTETAGLAVVAILQGLLGDM